MALRNTVEEATQPQDLQEDNNNDNNNKRQLTLILFNEVHNPWLDHGNARFWLLLCCISQRSKAPIVLTANAVLPKARSGAQNFPS